MQTAAEQEGLRIALKRSAAALQDAGIHFALGGSYALWAHGAQESTHDVDLVVEEADADRALAALEEAGFRPERPPENWLYKAWDGDVLVDLLFRINGHPVGPDLLATAESLQVLGVWMPVLPSQSVVIGKLRAMNEHYCDFGAMLPGVRAVREQLDWAEIERETADNDFAVAFMVLVRRLGIADEG